MRSLKSLILPVGILLGVTGVSALLAGIAGFVLASRGSLVLWEPMASAVPKSRHVRFLADLWAHSASYFVGGMGGLFLIGRTWLSRNERIVAQDGAAPGAGRYATLAGELSDFRRRVSVKAVAVGVIVVGSSVVVGLGIVFVWAFVRARLGRPLSAAEVRANPSFLVFSYVLVFLSLLLGGFLAGRIAKHDFLLNGALVGVVSVVVGILTPGPTGSWLDIPMAALGAVLARSRRTLDEIQIDGA